jgi:hypothetical protein
LSKGIQRPYCGRAADQKQSEGGPLRGQ